MVSMIKKANVSQEFKDKYDKFPWLIFKLDRSTYAINCRYVVSIIENQANVTPVFNSLDFVKGIIQMREEIFTLIDMKSFFKISNKDNYEINSLINKKAAVKDKEDNISIVLKTENQKIALMIDEVLSVENINVISKFEEANHTLNCKYLYGVGTQIGDDDENIILLLEDEILLENIVMRS